MRIKKFSIILILTLLILIISTTNSNAVLRSNGGTPATYKLNDWLTNIRKMEEMGGALGLTETFNSNYTSKTSNNLDCHMEKNTEYGTMAILSASSYGNPAKITSGGTTTGNKSGIYININNERVSAGNQAYKSTSGSGSGLDKEVPNFGIVAKRYKNIYNNTTSATYIRKIGDAISETSGWHGGANQYWLTQSDTSGLLRSTGSIFGYNGYGSATGNYGGGYEVKAPSRAVIVVGEGF